MSLSSHCHVRVIADSNPLRFCSSDFAVRSTNHDFDPRIWSERGAKLLPSEAGNEDSA